MDGDAGSSIIHSTGKVGFAVHTNLKDLGCKDFIWSNAFTPYLKRSTSAPRHKCIYLSYVGVKGLGSVSKLSVLGRT